MLVSHAKYTYKVKIGTSIITEPRCHVEKSH